MTLHEAIIQILQENGGPLKAKGIADLINHKVLYKRGDGLPIPSSQIHARVNNYLHIFSKNSQGEIDLKKRTPIYEDIIDELYRKFKYSSIQYHELFIPLLVFYKRLIDNPHLAERSKIIISHIDNHPGLPDKLINFLSFIQELNRHPCFEDKLTGLCNDLKPLYDIFQGDYPHDFELGTQIERAIQFLDDTDFTNKNLPVNEFSDFYRRLLHANIIRTSGKIDFSTTHILVKLVLGLISHYQFDNLYNPAAGFCTFPIQINKGRKQLISFYAEEINNTAHALGTMNLIINELDFTSFHRANSISESICPDGFADIAVCNPPFLSAEKLQLNPNLPVPSKEFLILLIQHILSKTNKTGKAIILVPEGFLFSRKKDNQTLRKYLVDKNILEGIISLPAGIVSPYSSIKANVMVLNKDKVNSGYVFINVSTNEQSNIASITENADSWIDDLVNTYTNVLEDNQGPHPIQSNDLIDKIKPNPLKIEGTQTTIDKIRSHDYNLVVSRYFLDNLSTFITDDDLRKVSLKEIIRAVKKSQSEPGNDLRYVRSSDLNEDYFQIYLDDDNLIYSKAHSGVPLSETALLVANTANSIRPTIFQYNKTSLLLSPGVMAFSIDTQKINPEFLVFELAAPYVKEQIRYLSYGTNIKRLSKGDFLRIKIKLPLIIEQDRIVKTKKELLIEYESQKLIKDPGGLKVRPDDKTEIISFLKHELLNITAGMNMSLRNIENYIIRKEEESSPPSVNDKVSKAPNSRTLFEIFKSLDFSFNDIKHLTDNIQNIINIDRNNYNFEKVKMIKFMKEEFNKWELISKYQITFQSAKSMRKGDFEIDIDKGQMALFLKNFLINTHVHGYKSEEGIDDSNILMPGIRNIVIEVYPDEENQFLHIELINDGNPFPDNFSFADFINFGSKAETSFGSGIGGYIMNRIIENHNGKFEKIDSGDVLLLVEGEGPNDLDLAILIGLNLQIRLPLKY